MATNVIHEPQQCHNNHQPNGIAYSYNIIYLHTMWHKSLEENFGELDKTNVICQYFTQIH